MTLVEFLAPLRNGSHRDRVLAVLYFEARYNSNQALTVEQLRACLKNARVKGHAKLNIADVLSKSGHYVDSPGAEGKRRLWKLTDSGSAHVRQLLGLPEAEPEIEHDVSALVQASAAVGEAVVRQYLEEGIKCLSVGARRASVVFLWTGAVRSLQERMLTAGKKQLNAALTKHDPRARTVSSIDHFSYVKDRITVLAALELGILDKSEKDTLLEALGLRNRCGHPAKYNPGEKKVSSFVEDLIQIVFK
jgi:hypothetical protein